MIRVGYLAPVDTSSPPELLLQHWGSVVPTSWNTTTGIRSGRNDPPVSSRPGEEKLGTRLARREVDGIRK